MILPDFPASFGKPLIRGIPTDGDAAFIMPGQQFLSQRAASRGTMGRA